MLVTIRQGIVRVQTSPPHLNISGGVVNINANTDPTIVTFANGSANYLVTESRSIAGAWSGPFSAGIDYWLYWDIDTVTGLRTFDSTIVEPTFGLSRPSSPSMNEHFFDNNINKMLVWNGNRWVEKIRVFAAKLESGGSLVPESTGSQANINQTTTSGHILFDDNNDVIKRNNGDFLTTEMPVHASYNPLNSYKIEAIQARARAIETIPAYHAVTWKGPRRLGLASSVKPEDGGCIGLSVEDMYKDEVRRYMTYGHAKNIDWNFTANSGTPVFVGPNGEITTSVPQNISMQRVGTVVDANTVFVDIKELYKLSAN